MAENHTIHNAHGMLKVVDIPIELYESEKGRYFIGSSDTLAFSTGTTAWARLLNPPRSGVLLHVNVWTVTNVTDAPFLARFLFNAEPAGTPEDVLRITPANTALCPLPEPQVRIQQAGTVFGEPVDGVEAYERVCPPQSTIAQSENGKLIFPPGGNFMVLLTLPDGVDAGATGRIAFGWWEEPIRC